MKYMKNGDSPKELLMMWIFAFQLKCVPHVPHAMRQADRGQDVSFCTL